MVNNRPGGTLWRRRQASRPVGCLLLRPLRALRPPRELVLCGLCARSILRVLCARSSSAHSARSLHLCRVPNLHRRTQVRRRHRILWNSRCRGRTMCFVRAAGIRPPDKIVRRFEHDDNLVASTTSTHARKNKGSHATHTQKDRISRARAAEAQPPRQDRNSPAAADYVARHRAAGV